MGTVPVPHTWIAGDDATSTVMQTLTDAILYLLGSTTSGGSRRPFAQMRQAVAQTLGTSGAWADALFDTEDVDRDAGHSTVTNTDRYLAGTTGWHWVHGGGGFAANASGRRGVRYTINATFQDGSTSMIPAAAANETMVPGRGIFVFLNAGDILRMQLFQNSGGSLNTFVSPTDNEASLSVEWRSN